VKGKLLTDAQISGFNMGTFKIVFSTLSRRGCLFQKIQWMPVSFPPANIYSNYLVAVEAMTMGAKGRTGKQTSAWEYLA